MYKLNKNITYSGERRRRSKRRRGEGGGKQARMKDDYMKLLSAHVENNKQQWRK
jgi:hypothetical protein